MLLAESIVHTLNPFALRIRGDFGIRWYGLAYAVGFLVAWLILRTLAARRKILLTPVQVGDFLFYAVVGVVVGGRLGHVLLFDRPQLTTFHVEFPWWGVLDIHRGGMSSFGGIIGVVLVSWLYATRHRVPFLHVLDFSAFAVPPGLAFGRLANWVNQELWGRPLPKSWWGDPPWWSTKFPQEALAPDFPRLVELAPLRRSGIVDPAAPFPQSIVDACYSGNAAAVKALVPHLTPHWPNQFMQAITDGPMLLAILAVVWLKPRKPGVIAGWFLASYGVLRFGTEQLREPDHDVLRMGPLTLPMLLSLGMVIVGSILAFASSRRIDAPLLGGLRGTR